jgi:arginyl-tRNA synthetase
VFQEIERRIAAAAERALVERFHLNRKVSLEQPKQTSFGELAIPVAFQLARDLKRSPKLIAEELVGAMGPVPGVKAFEIAGNGFINVRLDRGPYAQALLEPRKADAAEAKGGKTVVEHTNINPNKAAHIGHLRNAILGDTFVRLLRFAGRKVDVQNYIDNTGVQVADVVIGFLHMEKRTPIGVKMLAMEPRFDYYCWDLYAKASHFFEEDKARAATLRGKTLRAIEQDSGEDAEVAQAVADAVVNCHLRTMARLGIAYELLARESEILHLKFWDAAFAKLKESGAIQLANSGKMAGCWVMPWKEEEKEVEEKKEIKEKDQEEEDENTQDKIIVRSNGTVTYVGKDIAYQLWKFGLLGKDFHYAKWKGAPEGQVVWATTSDEDDPAAPHFGEPASKVYNVIDSRQAYLQDVVAEGLRRLGHKEAARNSIHFAYEIVALTPRCAAEMGYELSPEEAKKPYVEVSGRKGFGVKADDLLDKLEAATLSEVRQRHPDMSAMEQEQTAHAIAVGALRFFLLKFTRNAIIAFDFKDAMSFEGETGPYCLYAVVRIRGIRRKGAEAAATTVEVTQETVASLLTVPEGNGLWEVLLLAGSLDGAVDAAIGAQEPAFLAKYAFQLAQAFNNFYHKHHILSEADEQKRSFLLRLTELVEAQLVRALSLLGIEAPEKM